MTDSALPMSRRIADISRCVEPVVRFLTDSVYSRRAGQPGVNDLAIGNPHEMPLAGLVDAFQRWVVPQRPDWFAYKDSEPASQALVAESLRRLRGQPFEPADICMTTGGFAGLSVCLNAVVDPGDEAIFISPPWFFYEALIAAAGAAPVRVCARPDNFDLDLEAIAAAITPRTRAIIVNSPNNPTGRIYPPETLQGLADLLAAASRRNGRAIYLLSDEAYSRILFDGEQFHSPTAYYPHSFLIYTYGKTLLAPGQRIGYVALPPAFPDRAEMRNAIFLTQVITGFAFPNALLQHALPDLDKLSIDIAHLQHKRDWLIDGLRRAGYEVHVPQGTFYLLPRSPLADDTEFVNRLGERNVLCLPGAVVEMPGYFRISLTANDEMIERALPIFAEVYQEAARRPAA